MFKGLTENWFLKLLSLIFALILWFFVMGEQKQEVPYAVPLVLKNVPPGMMVASEVPGRVDVRISGPRTLMMNLRPADMSIAVDLKDLQPGLTSFKRLEEGFNLPSARKVTRVSPSYVDVKLERIREKVVPVQVMLSGTPANGAVVEAVVAVPPRVTVEGAESEIKNVAEVVTEPVDLTGIRESFKVMVPIDYRGRYTSLKEIQSTEVRVTLTQTPGTAVGNDDKGNNE